MGENLIILVMKIMFNLYRGGKWNDLNNSSSLPYVIEFDYIVTTSSWALYKTIYTNSSGRYIISETYDPSKEYYIQLDVPFSYSIFNK
jgi:hypothetical protein